MNINFIMQSMFITPKQAVELFNLNIDQNVSMFFWGEILHEGQQCWGLFLIADEDTDPQYLTGDERAEALHNSGACSGFFSAVGCTVGTPCSAVEAACSTG